MTHLVLRQYQQASVEGLREGFRAKHPRQILALPTGGGKCLGRDTPVLMASGKIVPVQAVRVGDALMGPDGLPRIVLNVTQGRSALYRVTPKKGAPYVVNEDHILSLRKTPGSDGMILSDGSTVARHDDIVNVNVRTIASSNATVRHCLKGWRADAIGQFHGEDRSGERLLPAYILGAWLGDGTQGQAALTKPECGLVDEWVAYGKQFGMEVRRLGHEGECPTWHLTKGRDGSKFNLIQNALQILGVLHDRHIPDVYKLAPIEVRRELLAGLIDSDGHITHAGCDWISRSERLAQDFAFLCRSVGLACYLSKQRKGIKKTGFDGWYWRASVSGDLSNLPMRDKVAPRRLQKKRHLVHGISIDAIGEGDYFGFEVDGDHLFLLGDFTVTHNSRVMEHMIHGVAAKGKRIMFVCERRVLVNQFSAHLDRAGIDHGIYMAKHWRHRPHCPVQIASVQTLEKMESFPSVDLIFIDEVHACMRKSIISLITAMPDLKIIGATATPFHPAIGAHFSNVVSTITMAQLVQEGFLVPFRVFAAREIDTTGLKVVAGEWKKDDLEERGRQVIGDVVADYVRISHEVFGGYRKTICFSCGVKHGAELAQRFNEVGINAVQVSGDDEDDYRDQVLEDFKRPDSEIKVVISVAVLSRGFDQTDVEHVILARPLKKSFSEHVQMVGRGARSHEGKTLCVIQDNSGNWLRFQDDWEQIFNFGVGALQPGADTRTRKEPSERQKEASKCPKCSALWPPKSDTCAHCGHVRPNRNEVQAVPGEMEEVTAGKGGKGEKYTMEFKRNFYAQLLWYAHAHGHNPGSAYHRYIDKFGVAPAMSKPDPQPVSPEVDRWIRSRNIRFAKSKQRGGLH